MNLFERTAPSPEQMARRREIRAKGRRHFIFYTGILRYGMPVFAITTLLRWHGDYGWHAPPREDLHFEMAHLAISLVIWSIAGCIVAVVRWNQLTSEESTQSASNSGKSPE